MQTYRDLIVWQRSVELVTMVYDLTSSFPKEEMYGLTAQMRRSAISIPSNIAEGYARKHRQEYIQFLRIGFSSGAELETQLVLAENLKFASSAEVARVNDTLSEVMKMLNKLIATLVAKP